MSTPRQHFRYPLDGDTDRQIHLQIEAMLDTEDAMRGEGYDNNDTRPNKLANFLAAVICGALVGLPFVVEAVRSFLTN